MLRDYWKCKECTEHPGKFEGENPETVYFYEAMMEGDGEEIEEKIWEIKVDESDPEWIKEKSKERGRDKYHLYLDDDGFVYGGWGGNKE